MVSLLVISYLGSFGGIGILQFPLDILCILPLSFLMLYLSQALLNHPNHKQILCNMDELLDVEPGF